VAPLLLVWRAGDDRPAVAVLDLTVGVLHEDPAEHALQPALLRARPPALAVDEDAGALLAAERFERNVVVAGREEDLDELLRELLTERIVDIAVEHDDAAVRRHRVGRERLVIRLLDRRAERNAARIRVLDDDARRQRELTADEACGGEV